MSKTGQHNRPAILSYCAPGAEGHIPWWQYRWAVASAATLPAIAMIACYSYVAPQLPVMLLYHLLTDGIILLLWLASAALGGWALLKMFHVEQASAGLRVVTATALGLGIISLATLALGLAGWLNHWTAIGLLVGCAAPGVWVAGRFIRDTCQLPCHLVTLSPCLLLIPLLLSAIIGGLVYPGFLWGVDDPSGYDVVSYHLQVPREWYELGQIVPLKHNVFSFFPFNVEVQYLLAMHLRGGPWEGMYLAQWMHLAYIVLAVAAIGAAVPAGRPRTLAILAAGSCAWLTMLGAVAYNEGGLLLYGTLAIAWILQANKCKGESHGQDARATFGPTALAGVMAGFACGCKLTGIPILIVGVPLAMLFIAGKGEKSLALRIGLFILAAIITLSPWLIRNQLWTGNPLFPEAMTLLGKAHFTEAQVERWEAAHKPREDQQSLLPRFKAGWEQVIADWRYGYLLLPLSLIAVGMTIRQRKTRFLLVLLAILIIFWLFFTHLQSRFFVLGIPIMAMLIARANWRGLHIPVILVFIGGTLFSTYGITTRLSAPVEFMGVGPVDVMDSVSTSAPRHIQPADTVVLIGEARAFWFNIQSSQMRYRTVFDLPGDEQEEIERAWVTGWPISSENIIVTNQSELERFAKTYRRLGYSGIPSLP